MKLLFLATLIFSLSAATPALAGYVSVSFNEGFIGDQNGNNKAQNGIAVSTTGITRLSFAQNSSTNVFELQGNDLPGFVTFYDKNNVFHSIAGFMNWRETSGSTVRTMIFLPVTGTNEVIAVNSGNYTITDTKALGLTFNGQILNMTGGIITGNSASVAQLLSELNAYLNSQPKLNITSTLSVTEAVGGVNAVATVTLSAAATVATTATYSTSGGTATNGTDYTNTSGTLTFAIGESSKTITVPILDDLTGEVTETFNIVIANAVNAAIVTNTTVVSIIDNDAAPSALSYPTPKVYSTGTTITDVSPTVTGTVTSYSISTALPTGLAFNTTTGVISGTPTVTSPATNYTITATNGTGSTTAVINITVNAVAPSGLSYTTPHVYTVGTAITALNPTVTGSVNSYSIASALPTGLGINTTTGVISGTPTVTSAATNYTVTATNGFGSTTSNQINITVNAAAPTGLSYLTPTVYSVGTAITSLSPTVTGTVTSYSISTPLPTGLLFNTTTGVISGTPSVTSPATDYTVTATNGTGSTTAIVNLTVNAAAPSALSYTTPNVYSVGTTITSLSPTVTGTVTSYSISTPLPTGLLFNTTTGVISGNPSVTSPATDYTVTATNVTGSTTAVVRITVNTAAPSALSYTTPNVYSVGTTITSLSPTVTGTVTSYSISTPLPTGLLFNTTTGVIS
ncbi:beta strand repeat-containing protein, partial [Aquirufa salirivi]